MKLKTALLAGTSLLAMTAHAHAFAAIGSAVISAMLSVGLGGLLPVASATAIGLGAVGIAATVAQGIATAAFLGRKPSVDPTEIKNTTQGSEGPGIYAFGRVMLGGRIAFGNTAGYDIYRLILGCFGPISAIEEYFYDGRGITVDPDGAVTSPPWARSSGTNLYVKMKVGTGAEVAWPDLTGDFPGTWTTAHRVRGIGQFLLRAINPGTGDKRFPTLFQGGLKELQARARVGEFYDPRDGTTKWTNNGVLHCLHWLRMLPGWTDDLIDFDSIAAVADQADELVPTLTGTAPRCQLSGGWSGPLTYDIMDDMLESAGLEVVETPEGKFTFAFIEDDPESELTLEARHIISIDYQAGEEAAKRPNICRLKYFSPERQYEIAEVDLTGAPWAKVPGEIDRYGEHEDPIELSFCCDASQAQRIARRLFHMRRADIGLVKTTFAGIAAWGKRTITIEIPDVGEDGASVFRKVRTGPVRVNDSDGTCEIPFTVIPDVLKTPWNPATDEVAPPPVLEEFEFESNLDTPAKPSQAIMVQMNSGQREARVKFAPVTGAVTAEANYRTYTDGLPDQWASMTEAGRISAYVAQNLTGQKVDFRVRFANNDGEVSYFSDILEVASLAMDSSQPAPPTSVVAVGHTDPQTGNVTSWTITVKGTALQAVRVEVGGDAGGSSFFQDFHPGNDAVFDIDASQIAGTIRARLLSSNGTPSSWTDATIS